MRLYMCVWLLAINCLAQKKGTVSIEIINSHLIYYDLTKLDNNPKHSDIHNVTLKDSILDFPKNIVTYKITNASNQKYFFALNDDFFLDDTIKNNSVKANFKITNTKNKIIRPKIINCEECFKGLYDPIIRDYEFIEDSVSEKILKNKNIEYVNQYNKIDCP